MTRHLLNGTLTLHDIRDTEAFTRRLIPDGLNHDDREDLHAYLIATIWELSTLDPKPWRTSFSGWVTPRLRQRTTDWQRQRHGRTTWQFATHTHTRHIPTFEPLDEGSTPAPDHRTDEQRRDRERDREKTRDVEILCQRLHPRVAA